MNGFLEEILAAEAEGRRQVTAAKARAEAALAVARRRAAALAEAAHGQSKLEAERVTAAILRDAASEKASRLAAARVELDRALRVDEAELRRLSEEAVKRVLEPE